MMNFIDFEVFKYDWMCKIVNPITKEETELIYDITALRAFYEAHKKELFVGYNIRGYDQLIFKAVLLDMDPKFVNDRIIKEGLKGFQISKRFNEVDLLFYDCCVLNKSLKELEAHQGHSVIETSVDFDLDRKLTHEEIAMEMEYCTNDVYELISVFNKTYEDFDTHISLIEAFGLSPASMTKTASQLVAAILGCTRQERYDEWDLYTVPQLNLIKYRAAQDWFMNKENHDYKKNFKMIIAGVEHTLAWGG